MCPLDLSCIIVFLNQIKTNFSHLKRYKPFCLYFETYYYIYLFLFGNRLNVIDKKPQWYQYFLCGVKGILDILPEEVPSRGFTVVVSGTIPPAAGLSSSSALVSAAALAVAEVHKVSIDIINWLCDAASVQMLPWDLRTNISSVQFLGQ